MRLIFYSLFVTLVSCLTLQSYYKDLDYHNNYRILFEFLSTFIKIIIIQTAKTMNENSLVGLYDKAKKEPTPAVVFIEDLSKATNRSVNTVRTWVTGKRIPDPNIQKVISLHLNKDVDVLFPQN